MFGIECPKCGAQQLQATQLVAGQTVPCPACKTTIVIGLEISLDPTWPASRIAARLMESVRDYYGDRLDVDGLHQSMDEIWVALQSQLTDVEKQRLADLTHVALPLNDFNARIASPPSRSGYFILFDAILDLRLAEIFTAPRNAAAWCAAHVRAAWGNQLSMAYWVVPAVDRLQNLQPDDGLPDSYSLAGARDFIFAHECGHLLLNHLQDERALHFGGVELRVFDTGHAQELEADAFAREVLCRSESRPLALQQMGVDWLLGFVSTVLAMRARSQARRAGAADFPTIDAAIADRRAVCWEDFNRRRAASPRAMERTPQTVITIERARQNIDNFNRVLAPRLADIYAELPAELMALQGRVISEPMSEKEVQKYVDDLDRLYKRARQRHQGGSLWFGWLRRLWNLFKRIP